MLTQHMRFEETLLILHNRRRTVRDTGTDSEFRSFDVAIDTDGSDGNIESCLYSLEPLPGRRGPGFVGRDKSDAARIYAAWLRLELSQDLHGANFRCPGDRAARKECREQVAESGICQQPRLNGRGHLPDRFVSLHLPESRHRNTARKRDPPHIVPQKIRDHHVLGSIFL